MLLFAAGCAHRAHGDHGGHHGDGFHKRFEDAEAWAKVFDDPARDAWQKPDVVIAELSLPQDAKVADLGAGTGYFTVRLGRAAAKGAVFGIDVEPDMVRYLDDRAKKEGLLNVLGVLATPDDARIPEPVDLVLVVNTYHHISDRTAYFQKLLEKVKPDGRVAIIDFTKQSPRGPPKHARLTPEEVKTELTAAGLELVRTPEILPEQYFLVFKRPDAGGK